MLIEIYKSLDKASAENFSISCLNLNLGSLSFLFNLKWPFATCSICNSVPCKIRNATTLEDFSRKIKCWKPEECPCRLCMYYEREMDSVKVTE